MGSVEDYPHSSLLESLPARPPTPPRETTSHDFETLPKLLIAPQQFTARLRSLQTPPGILSPTSSSKDSTARRKRVGFSSKAQYQEPPVYLERSSRRRHPTPVSLPSSTSRPVKGILKPTASLNRLPSAIGVYLDSDKPGQVNIAEMLHSTLQQLAGADRESKVDAYTMLFRGLKASSNLPDRIALQEKMGLFMQFIQRDLTSRSSNGSVDIPLVSSALKLLHTFLHFHGIASSIPCEFGIFLIDHCVRSFEDEQTPKEIVRHLMHSLFLQNFPPEVMTFERMGRLVTALHDIENHMTGKSIIQGRIHVYEKLVKQCPQQMAIHSDWLQDLFTDMLSSAAEIRLAATKLGLSSTFTLNKDKRLVSRALDLLNLSLEDKKYIEYISERLEAMLQNKEECVFVPRIWSVITLFIPNPDQWDYFKPWSSIIQRSFNHTNPQTKKEANLAWSRFTYRMYLDRRLDYKSAIRLVREPLLSQLKRKGLRDSVLSNTRNFYYYAFRPDMNLRMLDDIWDFGVAPLIQRLISNGQEDNANITQAASVLTGLFDCKTRRVWRENRIVDAQLVTDDELPAIESKWIRANSLRVFELVRPVMEKGFSELSIGGSQYQKLWRALVHSVASASAKDVKLHDDTAKFVANMFTTLLAIWVNGPGLTIDGKPCSASQFLDSAREFILILVQGLGLLPNPFMDKQLIRTKEDKFILHSAPSHRSSKNQGAKHVPLHHIFLILSHLPPGVPDDNQFSQFFESVFAPFFEDKREKAQASLGQELLRLLPMDTSCPYGPWVMCATKMSVSLEQSQPNHLTTGSGSGGNLGPEFREIVKVLERGLRSTPNLPSEHWLRLFQTLLSCVKDEAGDAGIAIVVVEQLATIIKDLISDEKEDIIPLTCIEVTIELIAAATHPRDKQAVDAARRRLWGTSNVGTRLSSFDPFDNLYKLLPSILEKVYLNISLYGSELVMQLLDEVKAFFDRGNPQLILRALMAIQDGLTSWVEDEDHRLTRTEYPGAVEVTQSLWQKVCDVLMTTSTDKLPLDLLEPLLCAAFRSTHREIVRITAETWNCIYENTDHIEYSKRLKTVLVALGPSVNVVRPGLQILDNKSDNFGADFTQSQEEDPGLPVISPPKLQPTPQSRQAVSCRSATPGSAKVAGVTGGNQGAAALSLATTKGRTPRMKPRHEDSQLHFSAIESSPSLAPEESQLLTERQKEIRERQRETAALFPEMRSSPTEKTKKARSNTSQNQPDTASTSLLRASTPDNGGDFEDCLTSTPTPRRGQPIVLAEQDQEMTDPPSSPPEPRCYSLLAELKLQANNKHSLDDWQFSSSPVSGSPNLAHRTILSSQPMELDDFHEELRLDNESEQDIKGDAPEAAQKDNASSQLEVIEETTILGQAGEAGEAALSEIEQVANNHSPITPSGRRLRSGAVQVTPRSDNDEFVDALSSPLPPSPSHKVARRMPLSSTVRTSPPKNTDSQSFGVTASFENDLKSVGSRRIEISLRSSEQNSPRKTEYMPYKDILPESPDQSLEQAAQQEQEAEETGALDTIEVVNKSTKKPKRGCLRRSRRVAASQSSQASQTSLPSLNIQEAQAVPAVSESQDGFKNVSPGSGRWWRKRKQSISSVCSSGGSKKARHHDALSQEASQDEVPESQNAVTADKDLEIETQIVEDLHENDVSTISNNNGLPVTQSREPSQELPHPADVDTGFIPAMQREDTVDYTDDEEAIHSQLTREEEASAEKELPVLSGNVAIAQYTLEPRTPVDDLRESVEEMVTEQQDVESGPSKFDSLMQLLRNGLDTLRSVDLTREQFYQAEDAFFEMRNELLEAEKRGRD